MTSATPAAPRRDAGIVQNWQDLLWPHQALHVDFFGSNPPRRFHHCLVLAATCTKITLPMRRNLSSDHCGPQMGNVAKKVHGTLFISVLHLAVSRAHPAQRLNATLNAFRHARALAISQLSQRALPYLPYPALSNTEGFLLRNHTNSHLSVRIKRKSTHTSAAEINRITFRQIRRILQIARRPEGPR